MEGSITGRANASVCGLGVVSEVAAAVMATPTNATAPICAKVFPSIAVSSIGALEHAGVAGLIARPWCQEAATLFAALFSCCCALGLDQSL